MCRKLTYSISSVLVLCLTLTGMARGERVGWWKLDETSGAAAADSSAYGNNGTCQGNVAWVAGRIAGAWQGDGTGDFIQVPHSDSLNISNAVTVAMWVNSTGAPTRELICKGTFGSGTTWWASYGIRMGNTVPATGARRVNFRGNNSSSNPNCLNSNTDIPLNEWTHIACTFDVAAAGNNQKIYFNGLLDAENQQTAVLTTNTGPVIIGADNYGTPNRWAWLGMLDDVRIYNNALSQEEIQAVMSGAEGLGFASGPSPADKATDVHRDAVLGWTPGEYAAKHDVYLGTVVGDVESASRADPRGVLVSQNRDPNTYDPATSLGFGQTWYWRIDEVNAPPDLTIYKGPVWSFTVEPFAYPISGVTAAASSSHSTDMGPEKTIDRSGINASDQHSTTATDMWLSSSTGPQPTWIQYQFDRAYKLHQMWVWNSNQSIETAVGFGVKNVTIEYSTDGEDWTQLVGAPQFAQATGLPGYVHNTTVDFGGVAAKYVKITANSNFGMLSQYGLSEVRFFYIPVHAREPNPTDGQTGVPLDVVLGWRAGREAATHEVYLGTDLQAVTNGTIAPVNIPASGSQAGYDPGTLDLGETYYWKVVEVNNAGEPNAWEGDVWSFSTVDSLVVDNMDSYGNADTPGQPGSRIWYTWKDGEGWVSPLPGYGGNGTGSVVDVNTQTVRSGKSLVLNYDNDGTNYFGTSGKAYYSEIAAGTADLAIGSDWTCKGVKALSLWFRGRPPVFLESGGKYTMSASGTDIYGTADQFRYAFKLLSGDGSIQARVLSVQNTNPWAKVGVMIRQNLQANSAHANLLLAPENGCRLQTRVTAGGGSTSDTAVTQLAHIRAPHWIKLERVGDQFTAYDSNDPATEGWHPLAWGPQTITMTTDVYIGLSLTSHNVNAICVAEFSDVSTTGNVTGDWQVQAIGTAMPTTGNDVEPLYVALEDTANNVKVVTHSDPNAVQGSAWQEWNVALEEFGSAGVNLASVKKMYIGVGSRGATEAGGAGALYVDDIRLYPPRCMVSLLRSAADVTGDNCVVDYADLQVMAQEWLGTPPPDLTTDLNASGTVDLEDFAVLAEGWLEELLWPQP